MTEDPRASGEDLATVDRLRAGDEETFLQLVQKHGPSMRRVARMYVAADATADECVQDAWLGVLQGLDGFQGRAALRTWIFRILVNIAKTRGQRESRSVPFSSLFGDDLNEPAVPAEAFQPAGGELAGWWSTPPTDWQGQPEDRALAAEVRAVLGAALDGLPPMQAAVLRMRDVEGMSSEEVRNVLELTDTNQRVLLHRARSKLRGAVEAYRSTTERDG
jgi:RNA polymerase sigma-70 factor (ECF subfamily)